MISQQHLRSHYEPAFALLVEDFLRLLTFVEPIASNRGTYSYRSYELLLRACTEFESLAKEALVADGSPVAPADMTFSHYRLLDGPLTKGIGLGKLPVKFHRWRPSPEYIFPFGNWTEPGVRVPWWVAYNAVKHNRQSAFAQASLENVLSAISAVALFHLVIHAVYHRDWPHGHGPHDQKTDLVQVIWPHEPYTHFSLWIPATFVSGP